MIFRRQLILMFSCCAKKFFPKRGLVVLFYSIPPMEQLFHWSHVLILILIFFLILFRTKHGKDCKKTIHLLTVHLMQAIQQDQYLNLLPSVQRWRRVLFQKILCGTAKDIRYLVSVNIGVRAALGMVKYR